MENETRKLVFAALMAALTCIATMIIKIPSPVLGYIHFGDGFVLLSGILLGPVYGGLSAGIGSMFADLLSGYASYAPATFAIKAAGAVVGGILYRALYLIYNKNKNNDSNLPSYIKITNKILPIIIAGIGLAIIVTGGYFCYEAYVLGLGVGGALANVAFNIAQNIFAIIVAIFLMPILNKIKM